MDIKQFEDLTKGSFPLDKEAMEACKLRWNEVAKPLYSLGTFEKHLIQIAGIVGCQDIKLDKKAIVVMCSDNGVVEEGVTQTDQSVTAIVAGHIAEGKGNINTLARYSGAQVIAVDIGMNTGELDKHIEWEKTKELDSHIEREKSEELDKHREREKTEKLSKHEEVARQGITEVTFLKGLIAAKVAQGTGNIAKGAAMSRAQAVQAMMTGINLMRELKDKGYSIVGTGEMGIGNTTTSSAMASVMLKLPVKTLTGPGAGLSKEGVLHKIQVIEQAIEVNRPDSSDPVDVLAKIGGFDIAGITGLFLGGMLYRLPVVIDGIISAVAALTACRINPDAVHFMLASHQGREKACDYILKELGLTPVIYGDLALGEGSGTAFLFPLLDMAEAVYRNSPTFSGMKIAAYEDLKIGK
jgi:nicotinate-nucleotide--dimethylbenzimidazole phosphoribosyltransferase